MSKPPAKSKTDKFMGLPLGDADGPSSDSDSPSSSGNEEEDVKVPKKKPVLSLEDLERAGYKSGPSVLLLKPSSETEPQNWNWCVRQCYITCGVAGFALCPCIAIRSNLPGVPLPLLRSRVLPRCEFRPDHSR